MYMQSEVYRAREKLERNLFELCTHYSYVYFQCILYNVYSSKTEKTVLHKMIGITDCKRNKLRCSDEVLGSGG